MFLLALLLFAGQEEILREFREFLAIPNVASDTANIRRNADWLTKAVQRRGLQTRLLEHEGAPPVVYAELLSSGAGRTLMFYAHYDGQPTDPTTWWTGHHGGKPTPLFPPVTLGSHAGRFRLNRDFPPKRWTTR